MNVAGFKDEPLKNSPRKTFRTNKEVLAALDNMNDDNDDDDDDDDDFVSLSPNKKRYSHFRVDLLVIKLLSTVCPE